MTSAYIKLVHSSDEPRRQAISQLETCAYIQDMALELRALAEKADQSEIADWLDLLCKATQAEMKNTDRLTRIPS